jgi:hypothetical protein
LRPSLVGAADVGWAATEMRTVIAIAPTATTDEGAAYDRFRLSDDVTRQRQLRVNLSAGGYR